MATERLGFGKDGQLSVDFDDDVEDEFIVNAWKDAVRRAWSDLKEGSQLQRDANDAFRVIAESRGSAKLRKLWEDTNGKIMDPDRAYSTLEVPKETDDGMLLTVFAIRVSCPYFGLSFGGEHVRAGPRAAKSRRQDAGSIVSYCRDPRQ